MIRRGAVGLVLAFLLVGCSIDGTPTSLVEDGGMSTTATSPAEPTSQPQRQQAISAAEPARTAQLPQVVAPRIAPTPVGSLVAPTAIPTPIETFLVPPVGLAAPSQNSVAMQTGDFQPRLTNGDIRSIDFRNGFAYELSYDALVTVSEGSYRAGVEGTESYLEIIIDDVVYGDLTGDGVDDAVVLLRRAQWHSQLAPYAYVYAVTDGMLDFWGASWPDYYSSGAIIDVLVTNSHVRLTHQNGPRNGVSKTTWAIQEAGGPLNLVERTGERSWLDLSSQPQGPPIEISPRNLAIRATVSAQGESRALVFPAEAGWSIKLTGVRGDGSLRIRDEATGNLVGDVGPGEQLSLPSAGRFVGNLLPGASGEVAFELDVSDARTLQAPRWQARSEIRIDESAARREQLIHWPEFTWASGAADLDAVNGTIADFVAQRTQAHEGAVRSCSPDERSMYSLSYNVSLVSYDLVTIDFGEFICLCESGDSYLNHTLVIDMNTGAVLQPSDILNAPAPQLRDLWFDQLANTHGWNPTDAGEVVAMREFSYTSVNSTGLVLGAMVEPVAGDAYEVRVPISFEELEGLVNPGVAARAASGAAALVPQSEGCGC